MVGRQADVMQAAYLAGEIAHRMVVPGGEVCTSSIVPLVYLCIKVHVRVCFNSLKSDMLYNIFVGCTVNPSKLMDP